MIVLLATRCLPDGRSLVVEPLLWGQARLGITHDDCARDQAYDDVWEYATPELAVLSMEMWDPSTHPEPDGWFRHPTDGRRRPDGDASREYVRR